MLYLLLFLTAVEASEIPKLSSKTVYDAVRGDIRDVNPLSESGGVCKPDKVYFLLRHGSRNFGSTLTARIQTFLGKLNKLVASSSITLTSQMSWYKEWEEGVYFKDYELVVEGMVEHYTIASRYRDKFPGLFPGYSVSNYSLQTTTKMRTVQSGLSFMDGLLHNTGPLETSLSRLEIVMKGYMPPGILIEQNDEDRLLRFVDCCPKYDKYINTLKWKDESNLFEELDEFKQAISKVRYAEDYPANMNDTKALYYLCAAEHMSPTQAHHSQFCNVFPAETLAVLDFSKDLEKYYKYSYPFRTTYQMSCLLLEDIIKELDKKTTTPVLKFGHEETVMPLLSLLGLFDDGEIMTHSMKDWRNRKMRVSMVTPFAGNVAFIRHNCSGESKVQVVVNEREVQVPLCGSGGCTAEELQNILETRGEGCDYDTICDVTPPRGDSHSIQQMVIAILLTLTLCQATYIFFHCLKRCPLTPHPNHLEPPSSDSSDHVPLLDDNEDDNSNNRSETCM